MISYEDMTNIITRIESIDDYTTDEYIDDIIGDVYLLFAQECREHFDEIVAEYKAQTSLPSMKKSNTRESSKQRSPRDTSEIIDEEDDYIDPRMQMAASMSMPKRQSSAMNSAKKSTARKTTSKRVKDSDEDLLNGLMD